MEARLIYVLIIFIITSSKKKIKHILSKFSDDSKLQGAADIWAGLLLRDHGRSEKWANGNLIKFNIVGYKILYPRGDSPVL